MPSIVKSSLVGAFVGLVTLVLLAISALAWMLLQGGIDSYRLAQTTGGPVTIFTVPFFEDAAGHPISAANFFGRGALAGAALGAILGAAVAVSLRIFRRISQSG